MNKRKILCTSIIAIVIAGTTTIASNKKINNILFYTKKSSSNYNACVTNNQDSNLTLYNQKGQVVSYLSTGEMLSVNKLSNNKTFVKVEETGSKGYLNNDNIQLINSGITDKLQNLNEKGEIINVSSVVNLRENPSISSNILNQLSNKTKINVIGKQGQWFKVSLNNQIGFIYKEYIAITTNQSINKNTLSNNAIPQNTIISKNNILSKNIKKISTKTTKSNSNNKPEIKNDTTSNNNIHSTTTSINHHKTVVDNKNNTTIKKENDSKPSTKTTKSNSNNKPEIKNNTTSNNNIHSTTTSINHHKTVVDNKNNTKKENTTTKSTNSKVNTVNFKVNSTIFNVTEPFTCGLEPTLGSVMLTQTPNLNYKPFDYNQLNATATFNGTPLNISYSGNVNNKVPGVYPIKMTVKLKNGSLVSKTINVTIKDLPPVIVLNNSSPIQGYFTPYSNFILGAYSVEGQNLSYDISNYGTPLGNLFQNGRTFQGSGPYLLDLSVTDQYGTTTTKKTTINVTAGPTPTVTGKNIILKKGEKFNLNELDLKVQNGILSHYIITTDPNGYDWVNSINTNKKGIYYVWVYAMNPQTYNEGLNSFTVTVL